MGLANLSGHQRCCHIFFHLLLQLLSVFVVVVVILILLLLLLLLLLPLSVLLINDIGIRCRANQLMFVSCTSICRKIIWGLTARTSRMGHCGLGSGADRIVVCCTDTVQSFNGLLEAWEEEV
jgi:hypothetical protein